MSDSDRQRVTCPSCDKGFRWQEAAIGKKVACKQCGGKFIVPKQPGKGLPLEPVPSDDPYELNIDEEPEVSEPTQAVQANDGKCPQCNAPIREGAVICMQCGFNLAEGKKVETAVTATATDTDEASSEGGGKLSRQEQRDARDEVQVADTMRRHRFQEYILPGILLGIGLVFSLINGLVLTPMQHDMLVQSGFAYFNSKGAAIGAYFGVFALTLVFMVPLLFGGMFFMVAVIGSAFGNLFTAIYKLIAMTVLIVSIDSLVNLLLDVATGGFACMGWTIRLAVLAAVFWPVSKKLFDMESHETLILFILYILGPMLVGFLAAIVILSVI